MMRLFVRSVETGSFSKAAAAYGLKVSSVSRQINSLEQDLGVTLFRRSTRQLLLTDAGSTFYERAITILAEIEQARHATNAMATEPTGNLRLMAPVEFGRLQLSNLLPKFMAQTPGISVDLLLTDPNTGNGFEQFDLSIQIGEPSSTRLYAQRFANNRYIICCTQGYLLRSAEPNVPSELREHNCLIYNSNANWVFGSANSTVEVSVEVVGNFRSNQFEPVLAATLAGGGLAKLPLWLVGEHLRKGTLRPVLQRYNVITPDSAIYGLYPEKRSMSPKVRAFIEFLMKEFGTPPHWEI